MAAARERRPSQGHKRQGSHRGPQAPPQPDVANEVLELQEAELLPRHAATSRTVMDAADPVAPGARLGRDPDGRPAWYVPNPDAPGQYLRVTA